MVMDSVLNLAEVAFDPACTALVAPKLARRKLVLPIAKLDDVLVVAMANPNDSATLTAVKQVAKMNVLARPANAGQLREWLLKIYGDGRGTESDDTVATVDGLMRSALVRHASDIHFNPSPTGLNVRFRVDGELEDVQKLSTSLQPAVISRLKVLGALDIAERRAPQDGGFTWRTRETAVDVRIATLPVRYGERVTLRLLDTTGEKLGLGALGLNDTDSATVHKILAEPYGLVLLTGPTGSGKTTTLYAAIKHLLAQRTLNILTVEDPIEYEIEGVAQAEVDASDKVNFTKALRSLLRHDPDVVMIGEIRDAESLDVAVKAALTGHLVLSTLHANDAQSTVTRLEDMGLAPHLIKATLRLSMAQRLVRALCPHCRTQCMMNENELAVLNCTNGEAFKPTGCLRCAGRGYKGRTGLFEIYAPKLNVTTHFIDDALAKCRTGITTPAEVIRALGSI